MTKAFLQRCQHSGLNLICGFKQAEILNLDFVKAQIYILSFVFGPFWHILKAIHVPFQAFYQFMVFVKKKVASSVSGFQQRTL